MTRADLEHVIRAAGVIASRSCLIDSTIGRGSSFQHSFGYCVRGVRLVAVCDGGWCLEVHDLAISNHITGREKDIEFTAALVRHGMVSREVLLARLAVTTLDDQLRSRVARRIEAQFTSGTAPRSPS